MSIYTYTYQIYLDLHWYCIYIGMYCIPKVYPFSPHMGNIIAIKLSKYIYPQRSNPLCMWQKLIPGVIMVRGFGIVTNFSLRNTLLTAQWMFQTCFFHPKFPSNHLSEPQRSVGTFFWRSGLSMLRLHP